VDDVLVRFMNYEFLPLAILSDYGDWHFEPATRKRKRSAESKRYSHLHLIISFYLGNRILAMRYPGQASELFDWHGHLRGIILHVDDLKSLITVSNVFHA
jgi:hypothetical protein